MSLPLSFADAQQLPLVRGGGKTVGFVGGVVKNNKKADVFLHIGFFIIHTI